MKFNNYYWIVLFFLGNLTCFSQNDSASSSEFPFEHFSFNGYAKFMQSFFIANDSKVLVDNLVHNRLNFSWYTKNGSTFVAQFRNRIFFGESVRSIPDYSDYISDYEGVLPLEWLWVDNGQMIANTIVDRLYYEYATEKYQFRVGRQRINWGINTTWNPNDIFNNYNIYDFDYEEREGADAIRLTVFPNYNSSFDMAYKFTGNWDNDVFALKYKFNKWSYDFQFLGGKFQNNLTLGTGWAGSIGLVGFKGELTYFNQYNQANGNHVSTSTSFDYAFKTGFYVLGTYLFNSTGTNNLMDPTLPVFENPNAAHLMPAKHNMMFQGAYPLSPILHASMGVLYSAGLNSFSMFPTIKYGLLTNLDFDLIGQFFWQETPRDNFQNIGNVIYWRLKYNF